MSVVWGLLLLGCAAGVVLLALFEIAFFSSSEIAVRALDEEPEEARALRERLADPLAVLIPTRLGLLGCAGLAGVAAGQSGAGGGAWAWFPPAAAAGYLLLREVVPAAVLLRDPERVLRRLLPLFRRFEALLRPAAEPLRRLLRRFFPLSEEVGEEATDEEVEAFLETGEEEGILEEDEAAMVRGVLELDEMLVREVMTPRPAVVSVESGAGVAEVERLVAESRHHRIPVFRDRGEGGVAGLVDAVDLIAARRERGGGGGIGPLLREVRVVPETKRLDDLLEEFKRSRQTFAVVVDERGSVSGIVTLRDISEEIVGEVREDGEGADVEEESDGVFLARGAAEPDLVSRMTGLRLPESVRGAAYDTLSGFVVAAAGRIPEPGEVVEAEGVRVEVLEADARRVHRMRVFREAPPEASPSGPSGPSGPGSAPSSVPSGAED